MSKKTDYTLSTSILMIVVIVCIIIFFVMYENDQQRILKKEMQLCKQKITDTIEDKDMIYCEDYTVAIRINEGYTTIRCTYVDNNYLLKHQECRITK